MTVLMKQARDRFHQNILLNGLLSVSASGVASNADGDQKTSIELARGIVSRLGTSPPSTRRLQGQTAGKLFESAVASFVEESLGLLSHLRPATWTVENVGGSRGNYQLANYTPYRHLDELAKAVDRDITLQTVLGNSYNISPDVLVLRDPISDAAINAVQDVVDGSVSGRSPLRMSLQTVPTPIVHAVISCKWTLRSDRAQNARSEALGLLRNRKGRAPHIAVVTGEPTPARIASLALGTGDIDTVYHFALPELIDTARAHRNNRLLDSLGTLVDGDRLRDIADLPLDLIV